MLTNTATRYGAIARFFHWAIALLVLVTLALGVIGKFIPREAENIGFLTVLYSTHKTIGITILMLAVLRVLWAVSQPRPAPIHPERKVETFAAETAHWALYVAIFVLPLSGWVTHAAEDGFAAIWWPFGQGLPFVPKSEAVVEAAGLVHWAAGIVLALTVAAHIGGAMKHALLEKDGTLARMVFGTDAGTQGAGGRHMVPAVAAVTVWASVMGAAFVVFAPTHDAAEASMTTAAQNGEWVVEDGTLTIRVVQLGSEVEGSFASWQATIAYDQETGDGDVTVVIDTTTIRLGSVTDQAKAPEFFDIDTFPQAEFVATIRRIEGDAHVAEGTLTLVGQTVPADLPFSLRFEDGVAMMEGTTAVDRRDFGMGQSYGDESSVGFSVGVDVALRARRVE